MHKIRAKAQQVGSRPARQTILNHCEFPRRLSSSMCIGPAQPRSPAPALCGGESGQDLRRSTAAASPPYSLALAAPPRPAQPLRRPLRPRGVPPRACALNANDYFLRKKQHLPLIRWRSGQARWTRAEQHDQNTPSPRCSAPRSVSRSRYTAVSSRFLADFKSNRLPDRNPGN